MKVRLKELGTIFTGNTPSKKVDEYWSNRDIKFIKPDVIKDELCVISSANEYISASAKNVSRIVPANSILVTCIGKIGRVGITEEEVSFNQQINAIVPNEAIIPKYLAYAIYANRKQLKAIANAPVVPIINKTQFSDFKISICESVEKQNKIVRTLDVISGIITHDKKKIEALDELIKARFVEMFNMESYPIKPLSEIAEYWNGLTYKPSDVSSDGTIVLRSSNIQDMQLDLNDIVRVKCKINNKKMVKTNDILMCSRNGSAKLVGKVALIPELEEMMSFGAFMMIIRSAYYPYLMTYFQLPVFRSQISTGTTTINQITRYMLDKVSLPVPDMAKIKGFKTFVTQVDKSKFVLSNELTMCNFYIRLIHDRVVHSRINLRVAQ